MVSGRLKRTLGRECLVAESDSTEIFCTSNHAGVATREFTNIVWMLVRDEVFSSTGTRLVGRPK